MEIFHSTKESWRCLGDSGESTGGHSSLRQQASGKKGNLPYRAHKINTFICLRRIIFLPFLPSLPSPVLKRALAEIISSVLDATLQCGQV